MRCEAVSSFSLSKRILQEKAKKTSFPSFRETQHTKKEKEVFCPFHRKRKREKGRERKRKEEREEREEREV
jgi:hypothetical protein